ncbi:hypothetical protein SYNPS1DRAFT_30673 [Syncephalis pseudoplumigaleata]|uniref:Uncharacterized protein n=1 Tax=Syncephalis pseudoplumigaleata TaxID=1712513 RepID=A0A4P9YVV6_9FUNG|nr:hypothetical protein SYNPS1DRAFT_30673 [Syncephalis pseudoplumigaleata]|eukprot:RKP23572.1 hypothetical protein SYNPS1DRAFT_30673 [Syncephalis pseudoplumigaleata]
MQAFTIITTMLAMAFAASLLSINPTSANPILARRAPPNRKPQRMLVACAWFEHGCSDCPDGYHMLFLDNAEKVCEPDSDDSPLLLECTFAGHGCPDCPDGWHQNGRTYKSWAIIEGLKYCYPNGLE